MMAAGAKIKASELAKKLGALDIDEGVRIESGSRRMFVNRRPSGTYVVQLGDSEDFRYLETAAQVATLVRMTFRKYDAWAY